MDEKVSENVPPKDSEIMEKEQKTREEIFSESHFEWIKTEREGDICKFDHFLHENGIEYVVFQDTTRVRSDLVGDVILMHSHESEILGAETRPVVEPVNNSILNHVRAEQVPILPRVEPVVHKAIDPVKEIFDKSKKKTEKITLTLSLKILPPDLYHVIKENFDNTDEILLQSAMDQIHDTILREALKKELQTIYQKRRKAQ